MYIIRGSLGPMGTKILSKLASNPVNNIQVVTTDTLSTCVAVKQDQTIGWLKSMKLKFLLGIIIELTILLSLK